MKYLLSEADNGRTVELRLNDEVELSLREGRLSGYRWSTLESGEPQLSCKEVSATPDMSALGQPNLRTWHFIAKHAGMVRVVLRHARSWDPTSGIDFNLTVKVDG